MVRPNEVFELHESAVRSYCRGVPMVFARAQGHHLWDIDGQRYTDLLCGAGALNYGHNHPEMVRRVTAYLAAGGPIQSLDLYTTAKAEFLERFAGTVLAPRGMSDYVMQFPGPAGTLAVEAALKLARKVTGRTQVVAFTGGFHGASLGSLAVTSSRLLRGGAGTQLPDVTFLPYGDRLGAAEAVRDALRSAPPAAVILETVQGEGGLNAADPDWLAAVRRYADEAGALVIVDDIQAGCGRTGDFFSFDRYPGLRPDLICLSKSLSGLGLPLAALLIRREHDQWAPGEHNGTFRGNNLAFVAATAALELWDEADFLAQVAALTHAVGASLEAVAESLLPGLAQVAGRGAMRGLRFADAGLVQRIQKGLLRAGIVAESSGEGRVLKVLPPLTMPLADWAALASTLGDVIVDTATPSAVASV